MRKLMIGTAAAVAAAVAGCDGGAPQPANQQVEVPGPEAVQNRLEEMPEAARNAVFVRAIRDSGQDCQHVESSSRAGEHQGFPVWTARCLGGVEWTIVIGNDGTASVLNPAEARLVETNDSAAQNAQGE
ncbi:hypothetical protein [Sphingosinicella sp. CPCC 101087]|uniref:hypothetical protein n=1 Tax=Sphingosinicella sp. CPCC 101087 TaxID=2497754 RepID=UPI00101D6981|nr:hypothetical protein [Sphingosinicella sp. CPCC 101087]